MPLTKAQIQADSHRAFSDFPKETITIDGAEYSCLVLNKEDGSNWEVGGEIKQSTLKVLISRDEISSMPEEGDSATFNSVTLRVEGVEADDAAAPVVVDLRRPTG